MEETVQISGRVNARDAEFLGSYGVDGKTTTSEKLRYALSFFRKFHEGARDLGGALEILEGLVAETKRGLARAEIEQGRHSEMVRICADHAPRIVAVLATVDPKGLNTADPKALAAFEERLMNSLLPLIEGFLRVAQSPSPALFKPNLVSERLAGAKALATKFAEKSD